MSNRKQQERHIRLPITSSRILLPPPNLGMTVPVIRNFSKPSLDYNYELLTGELPQKQNRCRVSIQVFIVDNSPGTI